MGAVYAGVDRATGARVAIKVVQATSTRTFDALRRFAREACAAATVAHPAVVRVINVDISDDGLLYQVQELVDGEPLSRWARRAWSPGDAARLGAVMCDALAAAHAVGVIHRDVKPENLMLTTAAPGLKLLDFGIAKLYATAYRHGDDAVTHTGMIIGTPAYMAPEQVLGARDVDDRADVYAAGAILFSLLSERRPFEAESPHAAMMSRLLHEAPSVRSFRPAVPESLAALVDGCLARNPWDRPAAAELAGELATWADHAGARPLECIAKARGELGETLAATGDHANFT
jgi:serine/threonine protein kinase